MSEYSVVPEAVTQTASRIENVAGDIRATGGALRGTAPVPAPAAVIPQIAISVAQFNSGVGSDIEKRADGVQGFGQTVANSAQTYVRMDQDVAQSYGQSGTGTA
ncbi:MAG: hypothetical protein ACRCZD_00130 [Phycicoccus sp.]